MAFKWAFFMVKMFQMVNLFHVEQCEGNLFRKTDKGCPKKTRFFFKNTLAFLKCFFYSLNLLGVKEKVLGIKPRKILRPVLGL